jgi:hypothetical protein
MKYALDIKLNVSQEDERWCTLFLAGLTGFGKGESDGTRQELGNVHEVR